MVNFQTRLLYALDLGTWNHFQTCLTESPEAAHIEAHKKQRKGKNNNADLNCLFVILCANNRWVNPLHDSTTKSNLEIYYCFNDSPSVTQHWQNQKRDIPYAKLEDSKWFLLLKGWVTCISEGRWCIFVRELISLLKSQTCGRNNFV